MNQLAATLAEPVSATEFLPGPGEPGLVSVVIPSYNRAALIQDALRTVLAQTYSPIEIIVVDDGSTDNTREVVESYGGAVRYVYQQNAGAAAARNTGFHHARGEFVALLDSDDEWFPWKLEAQVRLFREHPELGMSWTDMSAINMAGELLCERYLRVFYDAHELARLEDVCDQTESLSDVWAEAPAEIAGATIFKGDIFSRMLLGNLVHTSTLLVTRERLRQTGEIDIEFTPRGEDYEFHVRICSHGPVALIDTSSMLYRIGGEDQLTAPHMGVYGARSNLTTVLRWLERGGERITLPAQLVTNRLAQAYNWVGEHEMSYGNWKNAAPHLWQSLRHRPKQPRALMMLLFSLLPPLVFRAALRLKAHVRRLRSAIRRSSVVLGHAFVTAEESILELAVGFELAIGTGTELAMSGLFIPL
jgi:glycosyltransferase involved in cell wall biosynthesis